MRLTRRLAAISALLLLTVLWGSGCSGINASGSVSPATFLLPGLGQTEPAAAPVAEPVSPAVLVAARSN